jgi:2-polyprenyl-3-methyl-5-hydroxy-6-metoxy-1,4-benzoquinol methylase
MVKHSKCPLCSSADISKYLQCTDNFVSREKFEIYRCSACGFVFTNDYPEAESIGKYYESDEYISHSDTSEGLINKIYRFARNIMLRRKRAIVTNVTKLKHGTLLDIGSGTGHFASAMKSAGWNVKGIEINAKAREFSRTKSGLDVISPDEISTLEKGIFDAITLWHVLEHFHDPFGYASDIMKLLKPGGICVVALPNSSSFDASYYKEYWAAYDVPRHLWHFNPDTFRVFSDKTGFKTIKLLTLPLDVFYISLLSEKYKGTRFSFFAGIAKAKIFTIRSLFNRKRSSSMIYILQKMN